MPIKNYSTSEITVYCGSWWEKAQETSDYKFTESKIVENIIKEDKMTLHDKKSKERRDDKGGGKTGRHLKVWNNCTEMRKQNCTDREMKAKISLGN